MADEFSVHRLNEQGLRHANQLADAFAKCLADIDYTLALSGDPVSPRERALVVTKLQEACFFAKRALALQPRNQESQP